MSIAFTFPGQGAQRPGFLHALPDDPLVWRTIDEAGAALGLDARALDGEAALASTVAVQLGLLVAGVAAARLHEREAGPPDTVAGLSVGAYPAAVVAGVLAFGDALALVRRRAELMEGAFPDGRHGMLAILGLDERALAPLVAQVHRDDAPVHIANFNAPRQLVLAGGHDAMARVAELALARGATNARPIDIAVHRTRRCSTAPPTRSSAPSRASRCRRRGCAGSAPASRASCATRGRSAATWRATSPCRCAGTRRACSPPSAACASRVEMPPGAVLTKLGTAALPGVLCVAADGMRVDSVAALMRRERAAAQD